MQVQKFNKPDGRTAFLLLDDDDTIIEPVRKYLHHLDSLGRSMYTLRSYAYNLKSYFEYLKQHDLEYRNVTTAGRHLTVLTDFIGSLKAVNPNEPDAAALHSARSINTIMTTVLSFYNFLELNGDVKTRFYSEAPKRAYKSFLNEMYTYRKTKRSYFKLATKPRDIQTITRKQVETLVSACTLLRDKLLIAVLYEGGLRLGEALNLELQDFDIARNMLVLKQHESNPLARIKNMSEGSLPVPAYVMELFCRYISSEYPETASPCAFVNLNGKRLGEPLQVDTVEKKFKQLSKKCGFKIHPHMLRHSHATELIEVGNWDVLDVKTRLRHKQVQTTISTYIHLSPGHQRDKFEKFWKTVAKDLKAWRQ